MVAIGHLFDLFGHSEDKEPNLQYFSLLDLSPIPEGGTAADALSNTIDLARHAEASGYHRYWLSECSAAFGTILTNCNGWSMIVL